MVERLYLGVLAGACVVSLGVAYAALTNREATGAEELGATGLAAAIWAGGTIGLTLASAPTAELRWLQLSYVGIVASPIVFVRLAFVYTGYDRFVPRAVFVGLTGLGVAFLAVVWTNPVHHLYWADIDYAAAVPEGIATTPGPGFWAFVVFTYGLLLVGSVVFVRYAITAPQLYRAQTAAILIAVAAPWAINVPHALQLMTADYTPIALAVTSVALWVAMFRYRLTDVGPVALRTIFESISPGVYVLDGGGRVIDVNAAGKELFSVAEDEDVIGSPFRAVVPSDSLYGAARTDETTKEIVAVDAESDPAPETSGRRYFEVSTTPISSEREQRNGRAVVITDVTTTQRQRQQLEAKNERLDQFASVVSHDLRNPLFVAQGRLKLAKGECDSEHLESIAKAHDRMETLIEDLLWLAREGDAIDEVEPVDLASITERCWATVETAGATLDVDESVKSAVLADEGRLRQLLENLIRNAVEHGSTSPPSQAHEDAAEHGGEGVTVTIGELDGGFYVEDDGPGVPETERADVFDAGYSTNDGGYGFGLYIVEEIVDAHGWTVRVTDGTDGGARFEITGVEKPDR